MRAIRRRADKRYSEAEKWHKWMTAAASLASKFYDNVNEDDPFSYNETASVGFLATASTKAGYLALPEFALFKSSSADGRKRSNGRGDLWMSSDEDEWLFEFKQHFAFRGSDRDLERKWNAAVKCAHQVRKSGTAVAGLIISLSYMKRKFPGNLIQTREAVNRFIESKKFAWQIGNYEDGPETYIVMKIIK